MSIYCKTPQEAINALSLYEKPLIELPDYSLTKFVTEISNSFRIPMSAYQTGKFRITQTYICRFGGYSRSISSVKTNCPCNLKYKIQNGKVSLFSADWNHNHPLNREFYDAHFNCLTSDERSQVCEQQKIGVPPGQIRSNLSITTNKDIFYSIRKATKFQIKMESLESLKQATNNKDFTTIFKKDENGTLRMAISINRIVASMCYSEDYAITDDTASTNIYDQYLHVVIVVDQENKSQLLSFGILMDKTTNGFIEYFNTLKQIHNKCIRTFVVDRSYSQYKALKSVYPNSNIIFCNIHIGRDLEKYFGVNDDIVKLWFKMNKNINYTKDFVKLIEKRVNDSQNFNGREALIELLNTQVHWNPVYLIQNGCCLIFNSNRVEGFFGTYKQHYGYKRVSLTSLFKNLMTHAKLMLVQSIKSRNKTNNLYNNFPCFYSEDIQYIGKLAMDIITNEYNEYLNGNDDLQICALCCLRAAYPEYALPCRHTFQHEKCIISKSMLHPRYIRDDSNYESNDIISGQYEEIIQTSHSWDYSDIMAKISPYASIASKSEPVRNILNDTIIMLENTKTIGNEGMPSSFVIKGRLNEHPSQNVILGNRPREHNKYKCSICNQYGHNKKRCPNK